MRILICYQGLMGGTDFLFDRFAMWSKNKDIEIVKLMPGERDGHIEGDFDLVLLSSSQMHYLVMAEKRNARFKKIIIWILGMGTFQESYFNPGRSKGIEKYINKYLLKRANILARKLNDINSLCYTDSVGRDRTLRQIGINAQKQEYGVIVPIAINVPGRVYGKAHENSGDILRIGWVGRVSTDFKLIPILDLINGLDKEKGKKELTIVGAGDGMPEVQEAARRVGYEIHFVDNIPYEILGGYISCNFDILFAMGTSALDGAKVGVPTVVISPVRNTDTQVVSYRWIHESKGYSLGEYPGETFGPKQIKKTLEQVLAEYYCHRQCLGDKAYAYAKQFDEDIVFPKLLSIMPDDIDKTIWKEICFFFRLKKIKAFAKKILMQS